MLKTKLDLRILPFLPSNTKYKFQEGLKDPKMLPFPQHSGSTEVRASQNKTEHAVHSYAAGKC